MQAMRKLGLLVQEEETAIHDHCVVQKTVAGEWGNRPSRITKKVYPTLTFGFRIRNSAKISSYIVPLYSSNYRIAIFLLKTARPIRPELNKNIMPGSGTAATIQAPRLSALYDSVSRTLRVTSSNPHLLLAISSTS